MLKTDSLGAKGFLVNYAMIKEGKSICFLHCATNPACLPVIDGAPSVAMAATLQRGNFVDAANSMKALNIFSPFVVPFNCNKVSSTSFTLKSGNVILTNTHTCALCITSVDSSSCKGIHSQLSMSIASCSLVLRERHSTHLVTVFRDNCKLAIADLIVDLISPRWCIG